MSEPEARLLDVDFLHNQIRFWRAEGDHLEKLGFRQEACEATGHERECQAVLAHHGLPEVP